MLKEIMYKELKESRMMSHQVDNNKEIKIIFTKGPNGNFRVGNHN